MKASDIFGLAVRIIGVVGLMVVINHIAGDITKGSEMGTMYFIKKGIYVLIGLYLVWGAPLLVKFAYWGESRATSEKQG